MPTLFPDDSEALAALIEVYGEGIVDQYAKATFPTVLIKLRNLTAKNASKWIKIQRFTDWIVTASQDLDDTLPAGQNNTALALDSTPLASSGTPLRSRANIPFNTPINNTLQTTSMENNAATNVDVCRKGRLWAGTMIACALTSLSTSTVPGVSRKRRAAKEAIAAGGPATTDYMTSLSIVCPNRGIVDCNPASNSPRSCSRVVLALPAAQDNKLDERQFAQAALYIDFKDAGIPIPELAHTSNSSRIHHLGVYSGELTPKRCDVLGDNACLCKHQSNSSMVRAIGEVQLVLNGGMRTFVAFISDAGTATLLACTASSLVYPKASQSMPPEDQGLVTYRCVHTCGPRFACPWAKTDSHTSGRWSHSRVHRRHKEPNPPGCESGRCSGYNVIDRQELMIPVDPRPLASEALRHANMTVLFVADPVLGRSVHDIKDDTTTFLHVGVENATHAQLLELEEIAPGSVSSQLPPGVSADTDPPAGVTTTTVAMWEWVRAAVELKKFGAKVVGLPYDIFIRAMLDPIRNADVFSAMKKADLILGEKAALAYHLDIISRGMETFRPFTMACNDEQIIATNDMVFKRSFSARSDQVIINRRASGDRVTRDRTQFDFINRSWIKQAFLKDLIAPRFGELRAKVTAPTPDGHNQTWSRQTGVHHDMQTLTDGHEELREFVLEVVQRLVGLEKKMYGRTHSDLELFCRVDIGIVCSGGAAHYFVNEVERGLATCMWGWTHWPEAVGDFKRVASRLPEFVSRVKATQAPEGVL
uniref:Uncharacterized protein n=1 Tax=Schizophyllum commune (strain H4-8 / FGSC 9210) TaxID=578458 RepID=D8PYF3_SCHCM